jgi:hypothetical protein
MGDERSLRVNPGCSGTTGLNEFDAPARQRPAGLLGDSVRPRKQRGPVEGPRRNPGGYWLCGTVTVTTWLDWLLPSVQVSVTE